MLHYKYKVRDGGGNLSLSPGPYLALFCRVLHLPSAIINNRSASSGAADAIGTWDEPSCCREAFGQRKQQTTWHPIDGDSFVEMFFGTTSRQPMSRLAGTKVLTNSHGRDHLPVALLGFL